LHCNIAKIDTPEANKIAFIGIGSSDVLKYLFENYMVETDNEMSFFKKLTLLDLLINKGAIFLD
jgi:hypothetical protein